MTGGVRNGYVMADTFERALTAPLNKQPFKPFTAVAYWCRRCEVGAAAEIRTAAPRCWICDEPMPVRGIDWNTASNFARWWI
jgi:hypothetical protein